MPEADIVDGIGGFISRYRRFELERNSIRLAFFQRSFGHMKSSIEIMERMGRHLDSHMASRFNIFKILDVYRKEVKMHTAFLAHLLSPNGTHAQGPLFLETFLDHCKRRWQQFPQQIIDPAGIMDHQYSLVYRQIWKPRSYTFIFKFLDCHRK